MEDRKIDLERSVQNWFNANFNCINLSLLENALENNNSYLFEYIDPPQITKTDILEWFYNVSEQENIVEDYNEECGTSLTIDDFGNNGDFLIYLQDTYEDTIIDFIRDNTANYPVWGTLFEFKSQSYAEYCMSYIADCGLGIINPTDFTNTCLFSTGCGYSFYASHWIPLYLSVNEFVREKYKGVDYSDL
jgi:hypothetical protein